MSPSKMFSCTLNPRLAGALCLLALAPLSSSLYGQGCVIARGGGCSHVTGNESMLAPKSWQLNVAHRWFYSDRHFVGTEEQKHRKANGTQVINNSHFVDVNLVYARSNRLSFNFTMPFSYHDRSSLYEHLGNSSGQRFHTQSGGLGDMRVAANYWMLNPENNRRANFSVGVGVKAPTGDFKATDMFNRPAGPTLRYVDSSIQPGDGGWGATLETQGFVRFSDNWLGYANAFYLFNPQERITATNFSVPDAYMARVGVDYVLSAAKGLGLSLGARIEGVPSEDMFGGSRGSRRPGYAIAIEPGFSYVRERVSFNITIPIAIERNRVRTFGAATTGDAAFADYTVNSSISVRF